MRTRRPTPLFVAAALVCAALGAYPPASDATTMSVRVVQFSDAGRKLLDHISVQEAAIVGHLTGSKPATFSKLKERHQELKALFERQSEGLGQDERASLANTLRKHELLLARGEALARNGERLDPRLEALLKNTGESNPKGAIDALDQVTNELIAAATDPAEANKVFDNLRAHAGTTKKAQDALDAVRLDFAGKKEPIVFSDPASERTNKKRLEIKTAPPAVKAQKPKTPKGPAQTAPKKTRMPAVSAALMKAGAAAYAPFQAALSGSADFETERAQLKKELARLAEAAERGMGRDPKGSTLDAQVANLTADESREAKLLGLEEEADLSRLEARLRALQAGRPELAAFTAALWDYRFFLRDALAQRQAPSKTSFKPWELHPQSRGFAGIEVEAIAHDGSQYVGLRHDRADGSSVFEAYTKDGLRGIKRERKLNGAEEILRQDFDGAGKVRAQLFEEVDAGRRVLKRQAYDPKTNDVETVFFSPSGAVVGTEKGNAKTGEGVKVQLGPGPHYEIKFSKNRREIRYLDEPNAPYQLQIERVHPDGSVELEFRLAKDGSALKRVSPHVRQVLKGKDVLNWDVDVAALAETEAPQRKAASLALAKEVLKAIGEEDASGRKAPAFADFLNYNAVLLPGMGAQGGEPAIRLSISREARKVFTLVLQNKDGSRAVLTGFFGPSTAESGKAPVQAFLVQNEAVYDAKWMLALKPGSNPALAQARATRVAYEYLGDATRIWRQDVESELADRYRGGSWNPANWASNKNEVRHRFYERQTYDSSAKRWPAASRWEGKADVKEKEGSAPVLGAAQAIASFPGVKQAFEVSNGVSTFLYSGAVNVIESNLSGDAANLDSVATRSRNIAWTYRIAGKEPDGQKDPDKYEAWAKKILSGLTPGARRLLDEKVMKLRPELLRQNGITLEDSPVYFEKAMTVPPSDLEAYYALSKFGEGTYGDQHAEKGHKVRAFLFSAGETVVKIALEPATYVIPVGASALGKGTAHFGSKAVIAAETGATAASRAYKVASGVMRGAQGILVGSAAIPFGLNASHNVALSIQGFGTAGGSAVAGRAFVDLVFIYGMARHMGRSMDATTGLRGKLADFFRPKEAVADVAPAPAPARVAEVSVVDGAPHAETAPAQAFKQLSFDFAKEPVVTEAPVKTVGQTLESAVVVEAAPEAAPVKAKTWKESIKSAYDSLLVTNHLRSEPVRGEALKGDVSHGLKAEPNTPRTTEAKAPKKAKASETERAAREEKAAGARGRVEEQLEFDFMKDKPETKTVRLEEELRRNVAPERAAEEVRAGKPARREFRAREELARVKIPEGTRLGRLGGRLLAGGGYGLGSAVSPAARPPITHGRSGGAADADLEKKHGGTQTPDGPGETDVTDTTDAADTSGGGKEPSGGKSKGKKIIPPTKGSSATSGGGSSGGGGGGGKGEGKGEGEGKHPKVPKPGGFGGGGGAGGGDGGGGGGGGGGDAGPSGGGPKGGAHGGPSLPEVSPEAPAAARPAGFASPPVPARRSEVLRNAPGAGGGHSPTPSLARRFDGAAEKPPTAWAATPMKGLGAGDSPGMTQMAGARASALKPPAPAAGATAADAMSGSAARGAPAQPGAAPAAGPAEEDYSYTYLAPARHKYEFPAEKSSSSEDQRYLLSLGLRVCAALAVAYLIYHSEIGYLLGVTRRRRREPGDGPGGVSERK